MPGRSKPPRPPPGQSAARVAAEAHQVFRREVARSPALALRAQQRSTAAAATSGGPAGAVADDLLQASKHMAEQTAARVAEDVADATATRSALRAVRRLRNAVLGLAVLVAGLATFIVLAHFALLQALAG